MKRANKLLALILSLCLLLGAVPVFTAFAEESGLSDIHYENNFNAGDTLTDLADFYTYWAPSMDGNFGWQKTPTGYHTTTVPGTDGALGRLSIDESSGWKTDKDPWRNLSLSVLMAQTYEDFELTSTVKLSANGATCMGFIIGMTTVGGQNAGVYYMNDASGKVRGGGIGVFFKRASSTTMRLIIGECGEYLQSNGTWTTGSTPVAEVTNFETLTGGTTIQAFDAKLVVENSVLNVYVKGVNSEEWQTFGEGFALRNYSLGHVALVHSTAQTGGSTKAVDQYFDNFSISGEGIDTKDHVGSAISYDNSFTNMTMQDITNDFRVYYTANCNNTATGDYKYYYQNTPSAIANHFYTKDNRIYLQQVSTSSQDWKTYRYPSMLSYKHSTFSDFVMELEYNCTSGGPNHTMIAFGASSAEQSAYNPNGSGGYLLGFQRSNGTKGNLFLVHKGVSKQVCTFGSASDAVVTVSGYGSQEINTVRVTMEGDLMTVEMLDSNGDYVEVYQAELEDYKRGWVAIGSDYGAANSYFNRFAISTAANAPVVAYTASSIVFTPNSGYEYSVDGGETYSTDTVYTGLDTGVTYQVAQRLAASGHLTASPAAVDTVTLSKEGNGYGDLNGNRTTDNEDLVLLRKFLIGSDSFIIEEAADVNKDNQVNVLDLVHMKKSFAIIIPHTDSSYFAGKSALYLGDSISYGAEDDVPGTAWCGRIERLYGLEGRNVSRSGWYLADNVYSSDGVTKRGVIETELNNVQPSDYDYIIMQGGVNDIWSGKPSLGVITEEGTTEFDTDTTLGALEHLFYTAKQLAPNAKLGFIINFKSGVFSETKWAQFATAANQVCEKWGVACLDLTDNDNLNAVFNSSHLKDGIHPNAAGYDILSVIIGEWIKGI